MRLSTSGHSASQGSSSIGTNSSLCRVVSSLVEEEEEEEDPLS